MNPRDFVIGKDATLRGCVYTVIPVINHRLLDLPFHLRRLYESNAIFNRDTEHLGQQSFNDLIADSCSREIKPTTPANGLLTICVGSGNSDNTNCFSEYGSTFRAHSLFYQAQDNFLSSTRDDLTVDLQEDCRKRSSLVKAGCWPLERVPMESRRSRGVTETLMFRYNQSDGETCSEENDKEKRHLPDDTLVGRKLLTEGLTSNFFASENDRLITAPNGACLSGGMSRIVIAVATALGIEVERRFLTLSDSNPPTWSSAFLTSAAKPMHAIKSVLGPNGETIFESSGECSTLAAVRFALQAVLRNQDDTSIRQSIPYPLWSDPLSPKITAAEMRRIFNLYAYCLT